MFCFNISPQWQVKWPRTTTSATVNCLDPPLSCHLRSFLGVMYTDTRWLTQPQHTVNSARRKRKSTGKQQKELTGTAGLNVWLSGDGLTASRVGGPGLTPSCPESFRSGSSPNFPLGKFSQKNQVNILKSFLSIQGLVTQEILADTHATLLPVKFSFVGDRI